MDDCASDDDRRVLRAMIETCAALVPVGVGSTPRICICGFSDYTHATATVDGVAHPFLRAWYGSYALLPLSHDPFVRSPRAHRADVCPPDLVTKADVYFFLHKLSPDRDFALAASSPDRFLAVSRVFGGDLAQHSRPDRSCVRVIGGVSCFVRPELAAALSLGTADAAAPLLRCGSAAGERERHAHRRAWLSRKCALSAALAVSHVGLRLGGPVARVHALLVTRDEQRAAEWTRLFTSIDVPCARSDGPLGQSSGPWWVLVVHDPKRIRDGDGTCVLMYALARSLCAHSPCSLTAAYLVSLFPGAFGTTIPACSPATRAHQVAPAAGSLAGASLAWKLACTRAFALSPMGVALFDTPGFAVDHETRSEAVVETWRQAPSRMLVLGNPLLNSPC